MLMYPARWPGPLRFSRDFMRPPDEVGSGLAFITAPPRTSCPNQCAASPSSAASCCYAVDRGRRGPFSRCASSVRPAIDMVGPMPYVAIQQLLDPPNPKGMQNYWTADFLERAARRGDRHAGRARRRAGVTAHPDHPRGRRRRDRGVPEGATAFGQRNAAVQRALPVDVARPGRHRGEHRLHPRRSRRR